MVETDLRLVVLVVVGTRLITAFVDTVGRVVLATIHAAGHVLCHPVPLSEGQRTRRTGRTGPVVLRCTETGETELMVLIDTFGDIGKIAVSGEACSLDITVTPGAATEDRDRPTVLHETGADGEGHFVITVVTHGVTEESAFLGVDTTGHDVDRTTDRGSGQFGCTHATLGLNDGGDVAEALPVGPIDGSAFHIVHRHTVDHRRYIGVIKTTHPDLGVTPTATLTVGMYTRGVLQYFRKLLTCQTLLDLEGSHLTDSHRRLLHTRHLTGNGDVFQGYRFGFHGDNAVVRHAG